MAAATLAAWSLDRMNWPRWVVHVFLGWALVFNMIPPIALASAWYTMERAVGLDNTFTGLILAHATLNLPMAVWLMGVFVRDVPQELVEAARIDGCNSPMLFRSVVLPIITPGLAATTVLCFVFSWNEFAVALNLTMKQTATVPVAIAKFAQDFEIQYTQMAASRGAFDPAGAGAAAHRPTLHREGFDGGRDQVSRARQDMRGRTKMKTVFVLFDSLNRHMLGPYGGKRIPTPNFDRLAKRCVTFDRHYVGSLPCIPARRDMLTGRLSFLHRSWGPMEPFDNAFPELLYGAGVYSHLITDHYHYWEDGGATYHNRYDSYEFVRGQEGDPWKAMVQPPWERLREMYHERQFDTAQRTYYPPQHRQSRIHPRGVGVSLRPGASPTAWSSSSRTATPTTGCCRSRPSIRTSRSTHRQRFKKPFETGWNGPVRDWPRYGRVDELPAECEELRANYYASRLDVRLPAWPAARRLRSPRHVEGHGAGGHHRPRLPARRTRLLGQEPHEPLRGARAHPAFHA